MTQGKFKPATKRGRYITVDLTPPRIRQNKPGSELLVLAEVSAFARGEWEAQACSGGCMLQAGSVVGPGRHAGATQ